MKFCNFLLRVDGIREASIDDFKSVIEKGLRTYRPEHQKYLYSIEMEIIDDRFFWMSCDYDDAVKFRDYVINRETGEKEPNPRSKAQIEPKQQFFACYDCSEHFHLLEPLRAATGEDWVPGKRYRVRGFWVADAKTMCFDLNEGVQEDFRQNPANSDDK